MVSLKSPQTATIRLHLRVCLKSPQTTIIKLHLQVKLYSQYVTVTSSQVHKLVVRKNRSIMSWLSDKTIEIVMSCTCLHRITFMTAYHPQSFCNLSALCLPQWVTKLVLKFWYCPLQAALQEQLDKLQCPYVSRSLTLILLHWSSLQLILNWLSSRLLLRIKVIFSITIDGWLFIRSTKYTSVSLLSSILFTINSL